MLKFKKISALICAIALCVVAFAVPTFAEVTVGGESGIKATLSSGTSAFDAAWGETFATLNLEGLSGKYTCGGNLKIKVTKGVFTAAYAKSLDRNGLYAMSNRKAASFEVNFDNSKADYDIIAVLWNTNDAPATTAGAAVEIGLAYTDTSALGDAYLSFVNSSEDSQVQIDMVDSTGALTGERMLLADNDTEYKLASGTNVITEVEEEEPPVDDNTVAFEGFTGTKENGEADGSVAVATSKTFTTKADAPSQINWTVNLKAGGKGTYTSTVDATGGAEFTLGMVINGLAKELVASIEAVLVQ